MKRFITLSTLFLFCLAINAQEVKLTIETTAGGLKDAMTQEQRQTVTNLTLTGSMNDSDFYLIRDGMHNLKKLDIQKVEVEKIPSRAFYNHKSLVSIILPIEIDSIKEEALYTNLENVTFTGAFPKLCKSVFWEEFGNKLSFMVSEDNEYCKLVDGCIYSMDGAILYLASKEITDNTIKNGTERINSYAFDGCRMFNGAYNLGNIILPASVKYIESNAFNNIQTVIPTRSDESCMVNFICYSLTPPTLEDHVFYKGNVGYSTLFILEECFNNYSLVEQWNQFNKIEIINSSDRIEKMTHSTIIMENHENSLTITSDLIMHEILFISIEGKLILQKICRANSLNISKQDLISQIGILYIIYENGMIETLKIKTK